MPLLHLLAYQMLVVQIAVLQILMQFITMVIKKNKNHHLQALIITMVKIKIVLPQIMVAL